MNITQFGHLALNCSDLACSVHFYRDLLGLKQKFSITYGDMLTHLLAASQADGTALPPQQLEALTQKRDLDWIVYMEIGEGAFIELFNAEPPPAGQPVTPCPSISTHISLAVEDIFAAQQALQAAGVPIDTPPSLGLEHTWQMWSHDPDGNKIEFMQYTPQSWQLVGK